MAWFLICILSVIWGSSFILIKRGLFTPNGLPIFEAYEVALFRLMCAFLVLLPFMFVAAKKIPKSKWGIVVLSGFLGNAIPAFLFALAQTKLSSALTGVLNSLTPFFTLFIGVLFFKIMPKKKAYWGVLLGMLGSIVLIVSSKDFNTEGLVYGLLIVTATLCYGLNVNILKKYLHEFSPISITALSFFVSGLLATIFALSFTNIDLVVDDSVYRNAFLHIALLGILGTAGALILFNYLIKISSAVFASSVTYAMPIVAIAWGLIDGESFGFVQFLGTATIISGVRLIKS